MPVVYQKTLVLFSYMQQNIELDTISDVNELKALKADSYDRTAVANETLNREEMNRAAINARIAILQQSTPAEPNGAANTISGGGQLQPVTLDVQPAETA